MNYRMRNIFWICLLASLTGAGSFIRIPLPPVPFTLQTLFVYISGNLLGSKRGAFSQILFLAIGLIGIPIFAMGGGPGYVLQPTFGYLAGFPIGAWIIGIFVERLNDVDEWWRLLAINLLGFLIIFIVGVIYLYINLNFIVRTHFSWKHAVWSGVIIFFPGEIVKIILTIILLKKLRLVIELD